MEHKHPILDLKAPIVVVVAPSGAGKNTLINRVIQHYPEEFMFSVSTTTRAPRGAEVHGKEYYFHTAAEFRQLIDDRKMLEYEEVYTDKFYGTTVDEIIRIHALGKIPLLDIDILGAARLKKRYGKMIVVFFIKPPSLDELERRIRARGNVSEDDIKERMARAPEELKHENDFDGSVINDDIDIAFQSLVELIFTHPMVMPFQHAKKTSTIQQ